MEGALADSERRALALAELLARTVGGVPVHTLLEEVVDVAAMALGADFAFLLQHVRNRLVLRAGWGMPAELLETDVSTAATNQAGYTMSTRMPVLSLDTSNDPRFGMPVELEPLAPRGALSVLVQSRSGIWGVLVVASRERRRFGAADLRFLQSTAHVLSLSLDRSAMEAGRDEMETRLDLALGSVHMGIWEYLPADDRLWLSPSMERMLGYDQGTFDGGPLMLLSMVPADMRDEVIATMTVRHGSGPNWQHVFPLLPKGADEPRWFDVSARAVANDDGSIERVVGVAIDVTDRRRVEAEAEKARGRLSYLAGVASRLVEVLEPVEVAEMLVAETVGTIADYCVVDLYPPTCPAVHTTVGHVDSEMVPLMHETHRYRIEGRPSGLETTQALFARGHTGFYPDLAHEEVVDSGVDDHHRELLARIDTASSILLPLEARGKLVGGIALGRVRGSPRFDEDDRVLCEQLAERAAVVLDNARLFADRTAAIRSLQETLIPPELPTIDGLDLAARYQVAQADGDIGGDFYDVFVLADGSTFAVIGDVSGKGPSAAAVTGVVRQILRAVTMHEPRPAAALAAANRVLTTQFDETRFCTAMAVRIEGARMTIANAGHPPPYLVRPGSAAELAEAQGTLLGVVDDPALHDLVVDLAPGEALVMVTDGLTEARRDGREFGEGALLECLGSIRPGSSAATIADVLVAAAEAYAERPITDDLAVVVIACPARAT
jgi:PAS domain S-box-containing protein